MLVGPELPVLLLHLLLVRLLLLLLLLLALCWRALARSSPNHPCCIDWLPRLAKRARTSTV